MRIPSIRSIAMAVAVVSATSVYGAPYQEIEVPWTWKLTTQGDTFASVFTENEGGIGTPTSDSDSLAGAFLITREHTPPEGYRLVDPLPTQVTFSIKAKWEGQLANQTLPVSLPGFEIDTYAKLSATATAQGLTAFSPATEEIGGPATRSVSQQRASSFSAGLGAIPFSGDLSAQTLFGFGSGTLGDFVSVVGSLEFTGAFVGPATVSVTYAIPEPSTYALMLGGMASMAGMAFYRRKRDREGK